MINKKDIEILNPKHELDFTHVNDIAHAINMIIRGTFPYITDIGTGVATSVESVVGILANHLNFEASKIHYDHKKYSSVRKIYVDSNVYLHTTSWRPQKKLVEYLEDYANTISLLESK